MKGTRLEDGTKLPGTECAAHLRIISHLDDTKCQELVDLLVKYRIDEWQDMLDGNLRLVDSSLVEAALGAAKRFAAESLHFQETCFDRIRALHFRTKDARRRGKELIEDARDEAFVVADIAALHHHWVQDDDVNEIVANLIEINAEADTYIVPETEV